MRYKCSTCSWTGGDFDSQSAAKNAHDAYNVSSEEMCSSAPKPLSENTMKKSQLIKLIREVIEESSMSRLHQEISDSIETLIELGATTKDIRDVLDQMDSENSQEPEDTHNESGQIDPNGNFDAGGHMIRHPGER